MTDERREVLVIEDDKTCAATLARALHRMLGAGTIVRICESVPKAVVLLQTFEFRFILSDYDLGDGGKGHEVLTWIRKEKPELVERFLFVSANDDIINWGAHFLAKPFSIDDLRDKLAEMTANK